MRLLAETSVAGEFLPVVSTVVSASALPPGERELWARLSSEHELQLMESATGLDDDFWSAVALVHRSSNSQFDLLVDCARCDVELPDTFACLALTGDRFHGNRNRSWKALLGNLHLSSFCRIRLDAADCGPALSMLPTVAVTDFLMELTGLTGPDGVRTRAAHPWIKWVNDVYINDAKLSGSLVSSQVVGDQITSFVLGIGLNVGVVPELGDDQLFGGATSLKLEGLHVTLAETLQGLLRTLASRIRQMTGTAGRSRIQADYVARLGGIGRQVELYPEGCERRGQTPMIASGRLLEVRPDLSLLIEDRSNSYRSGRLRFVSPPSLPPDAKK
jgi:biotin-(acetyl-CoA carboxylase) ligase